MIRFSLVTPEGTTYQTETAISISLPTKVGVITVLDNHEPLMSLLTPGVVTVKENDDEEETEIAVSTGMVEIREDSEVNILADTAERAENIDVERALAARQRAEKLLQESESRSADIDYATLQSIIERETARIRAGNKYKKISNIKPE
jgi:F-type H+-transporting ATPase subunit epsilon